MNSPKPEPTKCLTCVILEATNVKYKVKYEELAKVVGTMKCTLIESIQAGVVLDSPKLYDFLEKKLSQLSD